MTSNEQHVQASEPDRPEGGDASANGHRGRRPGSPSSSGLIRARGVVCHRCRRDAGDRPRQVRHRPDRCVEGRPVGARGRRPGPVRADGGAHPEVLPDEAHVVLPLSTRETALTVLEAGQPPTELGNVDVVLPLLHGPFGEDGTLQGPRALRHPLRRLGGVRLGSGHGQALHEGRVRRAWSAHRALCRHHGPGVARRPRSRPRCVRVSATRSSSSPRGPGPPWASRRSRTGRPRSGHRVRPRA